MFFPSRVQAETLFIPETSRLISGRPCERVGFSFFPLRQDGEHLVQPERREAGSHQAGGAEDVPPVEEAERDALGDAVEPEAHQRHGGENLDAQGWPGGLHLLRHLRVVTGAPMLAAEKGTIFKASLHASRESLSCPESSAPLYTSRLTNLSRKAAERR